MRMCVFEYSRIYYKSIHGYLYFICMHTVGEAELLILLSRNITELNEREEEYLPTRKGGACSAGLYGLCPYRIHTAWKLVFYFFLKEEICIPDRAASSPHRVVNSAPQSRLCTALLGNSWHRWNWLSIWMGTCACMPAKQPRHFTHICS